MQYCNCRYDIKTKKKIACELHKPKEKGIRRPTYEVLPPEEILKQGMQIEDKLARALFFLLYVTGARIGEAVRFRLTSIKTYPNRYIIRLPLEKKREKGIAHFREVPIPRGDKARCYENEMMKEVMLFLNNNNKEYPFWVWGIMQAKPSYMSAYMLRRAKFKAVTIGKTNNGQWIEIERTRGVLCHYLRHCRATHCAMKEYYNMNDTQLRLYFDWASPEMAATYTHLKDKESLFGL